MLKEIGSNFWLDVSHIDLNIDCNNPDLVKFGIRGADSVFLSSGRASIRYALRDIKADYNNKSLTAIIPPYTCDTVLQPFLDENINVYTYDIDQNLNIDAGAFLELLLKIQPNIVFVHSYFGFENVDNIQKVIDIYRKQGCVFIEDRTQNLFSDIKALDVDYIIGSFRKWDAIPDGGFCVKTKDSFKLQKKTIREDDKLVALKLKAFQQKNDYMIFEKGEKDAFLDTYRLAEDVLDKENSFYKMSKASDILVNSWDHKNIIQRRRQNYKYVYDNLKNKKIFFITGELKEGVVPLYMVIKSQLRDQIQVMLRRNSIYAPVVWPKPDKMPAISGKVESIYSEVLCLPIDQRYGLDDMERMVDVINSFE